MKESAFYHREGSDEDSSFSMEREVNEGNIKFLNHILATEFGLFTKTLNYHWNITGPRFHSLHNFLEERYRALLETMDDVAERVRILGGTPLSTVKEMKKEMSMKEKSGDSLSANAMLKDLLEVNSEIVRYIKERVQDEKNFHNDPGTEDFVTGLLREHEKNSWMLRSHLI